MISYRIESLLSARQFVHPQIVGDRLYFISDLSGRLSLYAMDVRGSVPEPLLPPDIALPNPHHLGGAVAFQVLPTLGQILLMLDRDGDENYQPMFVPIEGGMPQPVFGDRFAGQQVFCPFCDPDRLLALFTVDPRTSPIYSTFRAHLDTLETVDLGSSMYSNAPVGHNEGMTRVLLSDGYTFGDSVLYLWQEGEGERRLLFGKPLEQRAPGERVPPNGLGAAHPTERGVLFISALFDDAYGLSYFPWDDPAAARPVSISGLVHSGAGELEVLSLAYAITIHKSQGSEFPAVVVPVLNSYHIMLQRNLLYTAITRARRLVVLVGDPKAIAMAVRNDRVLRRYTALAARLGQGMLSQR